METSLNTRLLVIDDERYICNIIVEALAADKYDVVSFVNPDKAIDHIQSNPVELVLTDLVMGDVSGVDVLKKTLENHDDTIVILMTAHPTMEMAISVLKRGAYDFLIKPFKLEELRATIKRGLAHQKVLRENLQLRGQVEFLKVASTAVPNDDIEEYFAMVLRSCITEFSAAGACAIEIDPGTGEVARKVCEAGPGMDIAAIVDESSLEKFSGRRSARPIISRERVVVDDQEVSRILISKPIFVGSRFHGVINLLIVSRFDRVTPGQLDVLTILANSVASAIANKRLYQDLQASYLEAIHALANAIEARDEYTAGHTDRVIKLATLVARQLGWDEKRIDSLIMGCSLHDIGKIGVPDSILNKPDRLTEQERKRMMKHPALGLRIIRGINLFKQSIPYIIAHHERYDGAGYPKGLNGEEIPIEGRLLAVVDTFDAIMSNRPYRPGAALETAVRELVINRGTQFDPHLVDIFMQVLREEKVDFKELYGIEADMSCFEETVSIGTAPV